MKLRSVYLAIIAGLAIGGCSKVELADIKETELSLSLVSSEYRVIGVVDAYGIRPHSQAEVEYVTLIPPPGIAGSEVGFKVPIEHGSTITITKVMETNRWFDSRETFIVSIRGTEIPSATPIRIELNRRNQGEGYLQLNSAIYQKVRP